MYITNLQVDGLKLLQNFELSFLEDGKPRMWTVILGENGRCKTSVLRAIALAASGPTRAHELADLPSLPDKRSGSRGVRIDAKFHLPPDPKRTFPGRSKDDPPPAGLESRLQMPAGLTAFLGDSSYLDAAGGSLGTPQQNGHGMTDLLFYVRGENLPMWLVAGYGTTRLIPRPASNDEPRSNPSVERLRSLFDRGALIGTNFADSLGNVGSFSAMLREALIESHVLPEDAEGVELRGRGGVRSAKDLVEGSRFVMRAGASESMKIPAAWLSQGYQSTIAWVADLLGNVLLETQELRIPLAEIRGLVLIDEIDLHLHPAWQVRLVGALKRTLPNVQFVVTTHSPMILPALRREEIVMLDLDDEGNVVWSEPSMSPMLLTGSEIYRTFFGIDGLHPQEVAEEFRRYSFLVGNPARTDEEQSDLERIRKHLTELEIDPGWEPVPRPEQ